jgi:hypothetical protein
LDNRICKKCGIEKDIEEFPYNGDRRGGRRWQCKSCMRNINKSWRQENKQHVSDYNKSRKRDS